MLPIATITEGDDVIWFLPLKLDGAVPETIADWEVWVTGKQSATQADSAAAFQLSTGNGRITVYDDANGLARVHLLPEHTLGLGGLKLACDVQVRRPGPLTSTALRFFLKIEPQITRA